MRMERFDISFEVLVVYKYPIMCINVVIVRVDDCAKKHIPLLAEQACCHVSMEDK